MSLLQKKHNKKMRQHTTQRGPRRTTQRGVEFFNDRSGGRSGVWIESSSTLGELLSAEGGFDLSVTCGEFQVPSWEVVKLYDKLVTNCGGPSSLHETELPATHQNECGTFRLDVESVSPMGYMLTASVVSNDLENGGLIYGEPCRVALRPRSRREV